MTKDKKDGGKSPREIALDVIHDITIHGSFSHQVLSKTLGDYQHFTKQDRAFITRLCEGTMERLITLDYIINQYSSIKVHKMKPFIRTLLRMSVYQLFYLDYIPESAVCNESVKLAKKRGFHNLSGFVNGILRNIIRNPEKAELPNDLSIIYSVPQWLIDELLSQYDYELVKKIFEASFADSVTTIRVDENKIKVDDLEDLLTKDGITVRKGSYLPYALKINDYDYLSRMDSFVKGYFQVQDESSMLVGAISGVKEGDYVIDVCAAPGGKSLHMASLLGGSGHVSSYDVSEYKVNLIKENAKRLGYDNISVDVWDALVLNEENMEKADVLIADLPCSGLGVIGKKSDIKYNMTMDKLDSLALLQRDILKVVSKYVKKNGTLIYSTCTINQKENVENLKWFLNEFDYRLESLDDYLPDVLKSNTTKEGYLQLIPGIHDSDGFFIAKLIRNS